MRFVWSVFPLPQGNPLDTDALRSGLECRSDQGVEMCECCVCDLDCFVDEGIKSLLDLQVEGDGRSKHHFRRGPHKWQPQGDPHPQSRSPLISTLRLSVWREFWTETLSASPNGLERSLVSLASPPLSPWTNPSDPLTLCFPRFMVLVLVLVLALVLVLVLDCGLAAVRWHYLSLLLAV